MQTMSSKIRFLAAFFLCLSQLGFGEAAVSAPSQKSVAQIVKTFVPMGYDNNDRHVVMTVVGWMPNACYQPDTFTYEIKGKELLLKQSILDVRKPGEVCSQTRTLFINDVDLGVVDHPNKKFDLIDPVGLKTVGVLPIAESPTTDVDSAHYVSVTDARINYDSMLSKWVVTVIGRWDPACFKEKPFGLDVDEDNQVLVVRPVLERLEKVGPCTLQTRYVRTQDLGFSPKGLWLLHVRSIQGIGKHELVDTDFLKSGG